MIHHALQQLIIDNTCMQSLTEYGKVVGLCDRGGVESPDTASGACTLPISELCGMYMYI